MPGNIPIPPLSVVESWPRPNYVDPVRRAWLPLYAIVLQTAASFTVILRLVFRASNRRGGLGLDDAFLILAWLLSIAFTAAAIVGSNQGLIDRHMWDVKPTQYSDVALNAWIGEFLFLLGTPWVKVSVLLFYRRLVQRTVSRYWRFAIWGAIAFTLAWTTGLILALIFNCNPTKAYWMAYDPTWRHKYHCTDTKWINPLTSILYVVSDLYAVALPWLLLQRLQIAARQKLQLHLLFGLGIAVAAISAARTWAMVRFGSDYDLTWVGFVVYAFSLMEYELGIVVACFPALRALMKYMADDARSRDDEGKLGYNQSLGSSPDCTNESWFGDGASPYGGRNRVVIIGGCPPD